MKNNYAKLLEDSRRQINSFELAHLEQNAKLINELKIYEEYKIHNWENEGGLVCEKLFKTSISPNYLNKIEILKARLSEIDKQLKIKEMGLK